MTPQEIYERKKYFVEHLLQVKILLNNDPNVSDEWKKLENAIIDQQLYDLQNGIIDYLIKRELYEH
jgi:hypothetical protein